MNAKSVLALFFLILAGAAGQASALTRNTYLGTSDYETTYAIVEAPDHTVYIAGVTASPDWPTTPGAFQTTFGGGDSDIMVVHMSADLSTVLQSTYVGGDGHEVGYGLAFDPVHNILYLTGSTTSDNFPGTANGFQPTYQGDGDTVIVALSADLSKEIATYLGGSGDDTPDNITSKGTGRKIAIKLFGNGYLYVTGLTTSTDFPTSANAAQPVYSGGTTDSYVAVISPYLRKLMAATYLGGDGEDTTSGIAEGPMGIPYIIGNTQSDNLLVRGAFPRSPGGTEDAFVAALSPGLTAILAEIYYGGSGLDEGKAIAVDTNTNRVYITGVTYSNDLPDTSLGAQPVFGGGTRDAYVACFDLKLSEPYNASYLGGAGPDGARPAIALDPGNGAVYVVGTTSSLDFPHTAGGVQPIYPGASYSSYVTEFTSDLTQIVQSTYLGGEPGHTGIHDLLVNANGVYTTGGTAATNIPNVEGAFQTTFSGQRDGLVSIFNFTLTLTP